MTVIAARQYTGELMKAWHIYYMYKASMAKKPEANGMH